MFLIWDLFDHAEIPNITIKRERLDDDDNTEHVMSPVRFSSDEPQPKKLRQEDIPLPTTPLPEKTLASSSNSVSSTCERSVFLDAAATSPLLSTSEAQSLSPPQPSTSADCQPKDKYENITKYSLEVISL